MDHGVRPFDVSDKETALGVFCLPTTSYTDPVICSQLACTASADFPLQQAYPGSVLGQDAVLVHPSRKPHAHFVHSGNNWRNGPSKICLSSNTDNGWETVGESSTSTVSHSWNQALWFCGILCYITGRLRKRLQPSLWDSFSGPYHGQTKVQFGLW